MFFRGGPLLHISGVWMREGGFLFLCDNGVSLDILYGCVVLQRVVICAFGGALFQTFLWLFEVLL